MHNPDDVGWLVPNTGNPRRPAVSSAASAAQTILDALAAAHRGGANAWDLPHRMLGQFDLLLADGDLAGCTALLVWFAEYHGYGATDDRERRQAPRLGFLLVSNYGRFGARGLIEALRAGPDNVWTYATRCAQRLTREARAGVR